MKNQQWKGSLVAETIHYIDELVSDPDIHNGQPIIINSQVRVVDVVRAYDPKDKESARKLAEQLDVHIGQVHAAMAYYHLHKAKFDRQIRRENKKAKPE